MEINSSNQPIDLNNITQPNDYSQITNNSFPNSDNSSLLKSFENKFISIIFIISIFFYLIFYIGHNTKSSFLKNPIEETFLNTIHLNSLNLENNNINNNKNIISQNFRFLNDKNKTFVSKNLNFINSTSNFTSIEKNKNFLYQKFSLDEFRKKEEIIRRLFRYSYYGIWNSTKDFLDFENKSGNIRIIMHLSKNLRNRDIYLSYVMFLYDGKEKKKWAMLQNKIGISLNFSKLDSEIKSDKYLVNHYNMPMILYEFENFEKINQNFFSINFGFFLNKSDYYQNITGRIENIDIPANKIKLEINVSREQISFFNKISSLSVFLCLIGIIQTVNTRKLIERFEANQNETKNVFYS